MFPRWGPKTITYSHQVRINQLPFIFTRFLHQFPFGVNVNLCLKERGTSPPFTPTWGRALFGSPLCEHTIDRAFEKESTELQIACRQCERRVQRQREIDAFGVKLQTRVNSDP